MKNKTILLIALMLAPFSVSAHSDDLPGQSAYSMINMMGNWWNWSGWLMMISFWILIVLGIIALVKWIIKK